MPKRKSCQGRGRGAAVVRKQTRQNPDKESGSEENKMESDQSHKLTLEKECESQSCEELFSTGSESATGTTLLESCEGETKTRECPDPTETGLETSGGGDNCVLEETPDVVHKVMYPVEEKAELLVMSEQKQTGDHSVVEKDQSEVPSTEETAVIAETLEQKEDPSCEVDKGDLGLGESSDSAICDETVSSEWLVGEGNPKVSDVAELKQTESSQGKEQVEEEETLAADTGQDERLESSKMTSQVETDTVEAGIVQDDLKNDSLQTGETNCLEGNDGSGTEENFEQKPMEVGNAISIAEDEFEAISVQDNLEEDTMEAEVTKEDTIDNGDIQYIDEEAEEEEQNLLDVLSDDQEKLSEARKSDDKTNQNVESSKFEEISEGSIEQAEQEEVLNDSFSDVEIIGETFAQDLKKQGRAQQQKEAESLEEVFFATENDHSKVTAEDKDNDDISDDSLSDHDGANMSLEEISDDDVDVSKKRKSLESSKTATEGKPNKNEEATVASSPADSKHKVSNTPDKPEENVSQGKQTNIKSSKRLSPSTETTVVGNSSDKEESPFSKSKEKKNNTQASTKVVKKGEERKEGTTSHISKAPEQTVIKGSVSKSLKSGSDSVQRKALTSTIGCQTAPREMKGKIIQCTINPIKSASELALMETSKTSSTFLDQFCDRLPFSIPKDVIAKITSPQTCQENCYNLNLGPITFADMGSVELRENLLKKPYEFNISFDEQHHGIYRAVFKSPEQLAVFVRQVKGLDLGNRFLTISLSYGAANFSNVISGVLNVMYDQDIQSRKQRLSAGDGKLRAKLKLTNVPNGVSKDFIHLLFPEALSIASGPLFDNKRCVFLGFSSPAQAAELLLCHDLVVLNGHQVTLSAFDYTERSTPSDSQDSVQGGPVVIDEVTENSEVQAPTDSDTAEDCAPAGHTEGATQESNGNSKPSEDSPMEVVEGPPKHTEILVETASLARDGNTDPALQLSLVLATAGGTVLPGSLQDVKVSEEKEDSTAQTSDIQCSPTEKKQTEDTSEKPESQDSVDPLNGSFVQETQRPMEEEATCKDTSNTESPNESKAGGGATLPVSQQAQDVTETGENVDISSAYTEVKATSTSPDVTKSNVDDDNVPKTLDSEKDGDSPKQNEQSKQTDRVADKSLEDVSDEEIVHADTKTELNSPQDIVILREDSSTTVLAKIDLTLEESGESDTEDKSNQPPAQQVHKSDEPNKKSIWESDKRLLMTDSGFQIDMEVIDVEIANKPKEKILYSKVNKEMVVSSRKQWRGASHTRVSSRESEKSLEIPKVSSRRDSSSHKKDSYHRGEPYRLVPSREETAERRDYYHQYGRRRSRSPTSYRDGNRNRDSQPGPARPNFYPPAPAPAQYPPAYSFRPPYTVQEEHWKPSHETPHYAPYHSDVNRPPSYPPRAPAAEPERQSGYHYTQQKQHTQQPVAPRMEGNRRERSEASPPWQTAQHSHVRKFQMPSSHREKHKDSSPPSRYRSRSLSDMSDESDYAAEPPSKKPNRRMPVGDKASAVRSKRVSRSPISISSQSHSLSPVSGSPSPERNLLRNEIVKSVKQFLHVAREIQQVKGSQKSFHSGSPPVRHVSSSRRSPSPMRRVVHNVNRHTPSRRQSRSPLPSASHRLRSPVQQKMRSSLGKRSRSPKREHKSTHRHRSPSPVSSESSPGSPAPPPRGRYKDFHAASSSRYKAVPSSTYSSRQSYGAGSRSKHSGVSPSRGYERKVMGSTWNQQQKQKLAAAEAQHQFPAVPPPVAPPGPPGHPAGSAYVQQSGGSMYPYSSPYPPAAPSTSGGHQGYTSYSSGVYQPNTNTGPYQQQYGSSTSYPQQPFMPPVGYAPPPPTESNPHVANAYEQAFSFLKTALGGFQQPQQQHQHQHQPAYPGHSQPPHMSQTYAASTSNQAGPSVPPASSHTKSWSMGSNTMVFQRVLAKDGPATKVSRKSGGTIESLSANRGRYERPKVAKDVRVLTSLPWVPTRKN